MNGTLIHHILGVRTFGDVSCPLFGSCGVLGSISSRDFCGPSISDEWDSDSSHSRGPHVQALDL